MSPPGHAAVSYLLGRTVPWLSLPAVMIGGILPDIDFLCLPFRWFNQIHRVATHNLWFVLLAAGVGIMFTKQGRRTPVFLGLLVGGLVHLLIDACIDSNPTNGIGVALFWPLSDRFFSPFNLVPVSTDGANWSDPITMLWRFLKQGLLWEVPCWALAAWLWWRGYQAHTKALAKETK